MPHTIMTKAVDSEELIRLVLRNGIKKQDGIVNFPDGQGWAFYH